MAHGRYLARRRKGGAGRWIVVLSAATTVLHLDVDTDQGVSDWLHRVPTQCRALLRNVCTHQCSLEAYQT